jgi:hypothetical protein
MRINIGRVCLLISFLLVSACASMQVKLPQKYDLGDKLEEVTEIRDMRLGGGRAPSFTEFKESFEDANAVIARRDTFKLYESKQDWIKVDLQSLILRNGPNEFYLLVLQRPADNLMTVDTISIVNMLNIIRAKKDLVEVAGQNYVIDRIYKIEGSDKMLAIKNQISAG